MDNISPNNLYAFILTIPRLGLLPVTFLFICHRVIALY